MAEASRPPSFKQYGVKRRCYGCGRKLTADEPLWFRGAGYTTGSAVFGRCCWHVAARAA